MKSLLIMCHSDPSNDPRPNRMIHCLKDIYKVTVAGMKKSYIDNVEDIVVPPFIAGSFIGKIKNAINLKLHRFESLLWPDDMRLLCGMLTRKNFDVIITHDLSLLPFAMRIKGNAKVVFDAREYYPRHYESQFFWRFFFRKLNEYLCGTYIHQCDYVFTVSDGIAEEYRQFYGKKPEIIMSLPSYYPGKPSKIDPAKIRIIHHGNASAVRRIEGMIEMMDYVDERFILDLMLLPLEESYFKKIEKSTAKRENVNIIPPVPYNEIVPFTNNYDIGLFLVPPSTFNLRYTLPNKLFEFIQARLSVAIGPSIEMKKIVEKFDCGVIAANFEPQSLARELNKLSVEKIMYYKYQSHNAASELTAQSNCSKVTKTVRNLIGE